MSLISAKGEFPRTIISASNAYMLNGILHQASLPGYPVGVDGAQIYVVVAPQASGQSQNVRDAQILAWANDGSGFRRLDSTAIMKHGRDASGVLISADLSFEIQAPDGVHTCKLLGDYSGGDSMPFQVVAATGAD